MPRVLLLPAIVFSFAALTACSTQQPIRTACYSQVQPGLASGQTPAGVVGISVPDVYYQSVNSFPKGAASVDGCL